MSRIRGIFELKENDKYIYKNKEIIGVKIDNKINYKEDKTSVVITINKDKISMKRVSSDYKIELNFSTNENSLGKYILKNYNLSLPIEVNTDKILISEEKIEIKYTVEDNKYVFLLEYEVIS